MNKQKENLGMVTLHQTKELLMDAGAILLDVRPSTKVSGENAQEAGIVNAFYTPYPEFTNYLDELPSDHTNPIVVACLKGWFANRVMGYLEMMGYENVYVEQYRRSDRSASCTCRQVKCEAGQKSRFHFQIYLLFERDSCSKPSH